MDLLEHLAVIESTDRTASIEPGTRLRMLGHYRWPVAVLTVESVRPFSGRTLDGTEIEDVVIVTTSDHPGPTWSSYNRSWFGWWVLEHMEVIPVVGGAS